MDVASEDYGSFLIVSVAAPDPVTGGWSLYIYICRSTDYRITTRIEARRQFETKEKAHLFGVTRACLWIDNEKSSDLLKRLQQQITERELAVKEAEENERLFRAFLEAAPDAMVIADQAGQINLVNGQTERLFGYDRTELLGKPVEILVPQRFVATHRTHRDAFAQNPRT